jgi:hypothetical protein
MSARPINYAGERSAGMLQAQREFRANLQEVEALLADLQREVARRRAAPGLPDFGDVGDLSYARKELLDVAQFLGIRKEGA